MRKAAETVAWAAFGGERDDWFFPPWENLGEVVWLRSWATYWRMQREKS